MPPAPMQQGVPLPMARPQDAPQGAADMPPMAQPTAGRIPLPAAMPPPQEPGIGDRLGAGLMGFANGSAPLPAIANLIGGLATGQRQDQLGIQQQQLRQAQTAAVHYIANASDIDPQMKVAMIQNPMLAVQYLASRSKPAEYKFEKAEQIYGRFNPQTGQFDPQGVAPKLEKLGAGDTLYSVAPGMAPSQVATGGPDKPPPGYTWNDPANPSAGLRPIPGGPESKLPANEAAYLAMLDSSRAGVEKAKQYFLSKDFKSGPLDAAGLAIGQGLNAGEISRQQRAIRYAAEAALRLATGAAAPEPEVKRYADFYTPSVYDSQATREQKLNALTRFMDHAKANMGRGRLPEPEAFMKGSTASDGWSVRRLP